MRLSSRVLLFFFWSGILFANEAIRDRVEAIIRQRHPTDSKATWLALGTEAPPVIRDMAHETKSTADKMRLMQGLAWFGQDDDLEWIKSEARKTEKSVLRNTAIRTIGLVRGKTETAFLSSFLDHPDAQTRLEAAQAIRQSGTSEGADRLKKWEESEPLAWVKKKSYGEKPAPPKASGTLLVRSSADLKYNREFLGEWRGTVAARFASGISARESILIASETGTPKDIRFELKLPGDAPLVFTWETFSGQGSVFTGEWTLKSGAFAAKKIPGQLNLSAFAGQVWVEFVSKQIPWHGVWVR